MNSLTEELDSKIRQLRKQEKDIFTKLDLGKYTKKESDPGWIKFGCLQNHINDLEHIKRRISQPSALKWNEVTE